MTHTAEPDRKTPWHVRLGQFLLAACAAVGIKAFQKGDLPPPARPGLSRYAPRAGDMTRALWALDHQQRSSTPSSPLGGTSAVSPIPATLPKETPADVQSALAADPPPPPAWPAPRTVEADVRSAPAADPTPRAAPPPRPEVPLEIVTAPEVDERLFLVRALETLYERWPVGVDDPGQLGAALDALRHEAVRHERYIKERGIDDRIASLYGELVGLLDDYGACLAKVGRIEREGIARAERERAEGVAQSSFSGGVLAGRALHEGASGSEALATWAGATLLGSLMDELGKGSDRDEAKREALEANASKFGRRYSEAVATAESAATALAERHVWAKGEAGFDATPEQAQQAVGFIQKGDIAGILRLVDLALARRPRDPFARCSAALLRAQSLGKAGTPEAYSAGSESCLEAAGLIPGGAFYDAYRADFLAVAGLLANAAANAELRKRGWIAAPAARGPQALRIWRAYLAIAPHDPGGEAREQLAWALALTGRHAEAATTAAKIVDRRGNDPDFAYCYACLLSLTGSPEDSLRWLEHAFRSCHYAEVVHARTDPDLALVRTREAAGFGELTAVKFSWSIDWGTISHDDICLTNNSSFPLTGVTLDVAVTSKGAAPWSRSLTAERIEPGSTYRWKTWVTARGGDADGKATLACDQQR